MAVFFLKKESTNESGWDGAWGRSGRRRRRRRREEKGGGKMEGSLFFFVATISFW
jgi:hypothetical protein